MSGTGVTVRARPFSVMLKLLSAVLVLFTVWHSASVASPSNRVLRAEQEYAEIAGGFARRIQREHLTRQVLNDAVACRAWTNYLFTLDFDRVHFLQSDIDGFKTSQTLLDDRLKDGDIDFAYEVFEVFKKRLRNRHRYVAELLEKGFDVDRQETYIWKRKDMPWPRDEAEWNETWRKKIKNEFIRRVVAKELEAEREAERIERTPGDDDRDDPGVGRDDATSTDSTTSEPAVIDSDDETEPEDATRQLPPAEFILNRHKQILTVIEDSDPEWILERYLSAFAHAYDPHSLYMSPSAVEDFDIEMKLSLVGIGALLRSEDGAAKIVRVLPGGPADRDDREKRLRSGDKIIAVAQGDKDPVDVLHWSLRKIVRLIRGEKGTRVVLTVIPVSDPTGAVTKKVDLVRDEVKLEAQAAQGKTHQSEGSDGTIRKLGVIKLPAFYADMKSTAGKASDRRSSADDVEGILRDMKQQKVEGVLLDLRNNGGGSLLEAVRMTGLFISTGPTVQVEERYRLRVLPDMDPLLAYDGALVVLVNRLSASASEILAGALQDYGRAIIVGDSKTHGKGTVQTVMQIGRDRRLGAAKITSARYYRISGSSTQLKGISPDVVISSPWDFMETGEDRLSNPIPWSRVDTTGYLPIANLASVVPVLKEKSVNRRAGNSRFAAYSKLLERIDRMTRTRELSLNLDERRHLARTEQELLDLQNQFAGEEDSGDGEKKDAPDLVLDEALFILGELVDKHEELHMSAQPKALRKMTWWEELLDGMID